MSFDHPPCDLARPFFSQPLILDDACACPLTANPHPKSHIQHVTPSLAPNMRWKGFPPVSCALAAALLCSECQCRAMCPASAPLLPAFAPLLPESASMPYPLCPCIDPLSPCTQHVASTPTTSACWWACICIPLHTSLLTSIELSLVCRWYLY